MTWPAVFPFACDMLYEQYGNRQPIIDSYPYIKKWLDHMLKEYCHDGIITKDKYGDWCVPPEKLTITSDRRHTDIDGLWCAHPATDGEVRALARDGH